MASWGIVLGKLADIEAVTHQINERLKLVDTFLEGIDMAFIGHEQTAAIRSETLEIHDYLKEIRIELADDLTRPQLVSRDHA